jgi:tetratricopeptide (TPR) repeat protein
VAPIALVLIGASLVAAGLDVAADHEVKSALAESASGRSEQALAAADRAVDLRPDSIRYWFAAATVAARSGSGAGLDAALLRFDRGLVISPGDPILLREWAATLLTKARRSGDAGDIAVAIDGWEGLVAADPNSARNRLELGVAYAAANRLKEAETAWLKAADLAPTSVAPWVNLAVLYLESDRPADARAAVEQAESIDPDDPGLGEVRNRIEEEIVS